jgi:hypothetical protein
MNKKQQNKARKVMHEFKTGTLHGGIDPAGPKKPPVVKNRSKAGRYEERQAVCATARQDCQEDSKV